MALSLHLTFKLGVTITLLQGFSYCLASFCKQRIEYWGGDTREVYRLSKKNRLICCRADAHHLCKAAFLAKKIPVPKCTACDCLLHQNGKLHIDFCGAVDHTFARRETLNAAKFWKSHICSQLASMQYMSRHICLQ